MAERKNNMLHCELRGEKLPGTVKFARLCCAFLLSVALLSALPTSRAFADGDSADPVPVDPTPVEIPTENVPTAPTQQGESGQTTETSVSEGDILDTPEEPNTDGGTEEGTVTIAGVIFDNGGSTGPVLETIDGLETVSFKGDGKSDVLKNAVDTALNIAVGEYGGKHGTVVLSVGNGTYGSEVKIDANHMDKDGKLASALMIIAEDALTVGEDKRVTLGDSAGMAKLEANVAVDSMELILYGLYLSMDSVIKAKDSSVQIVGSKNNDNINVELTNTEGKRFALDVDGRGGDDSITVTQTGGRYTTNTEPMPISIDGGAGNDDISLQMGGMQTVTAAVSGGEGDDGISVSVANESVETKPEGAETAAKVKKVIVRDTQGDNTVSVDFKKSSALLSVELGEGDDSVTLTATQDAKDCAIEALALGDGNDTLTVDVLLADALLSSERTVTADGGDGIDTLQLKGTLKSDGDRIGGSRDSLYTVSEKGNRLTLSLGGSFENFVDELVNKPTVEIKAVDSEGYALIDQGGTNVRFIPKAFTTYTYNKGARTTVAEDTVNDTPAYTELNLQKLIMQQPQDGGLLSVLRITDTANKITVGDITAKGMALIIVAGEIEVKGHVQANGISIKGTASDDSKKLNPGNTKKPEGVGDKFKDISFDFFKVSGDAKITVTETGFLDTSCNPMGVVKLNTDANFTKMLLELCDGLAGINFANVKLVSSIINISGRIQSCAIQAAAMVRVKAEASNSIVSLLFVPLSIAVGVVEAGVRILGGASLEAKDDISLTAQSDVTMKAEAGTGRLPLSLAVSVLDNQVYSRVEGSANVISREGKVTMKASAASAVTTKACKGAEDTGSSGGYFAIAVVNQNVNAGVYGGACVSAAEDVSIASSSRERLNTSAVSAKPENENQELTGELSLELVEKFATGIFNSIIKSVATGAANKLTKAKDKVGGSGSAIELGNTEHGSVAASAAKAKENDTVTLTVNNDKDYVLDNVKVIDKDGKEIAVTAVKDKATYTFTMPKSAVKVSAKFKEQKGNPASDNRGSGSSGGSSINDIVKKASANSTDANRAVNSERTPTDAATQKQKKLTVDGSIQNGTVQADIAKLENQADIYVLPGKQVKVTYNPGEKYIIDTLKAKYKDSGSVEHEIIISPNLNGEYVFTMPEAAVTITATFKQGTDSGKSQSGTQLVGAAAVSVATNQSTALVETTGNVATTGRLSVVSDSTTDCANKADATQNKADNPTDKSDPDDEIVAGKSVSAHLEVAQLRNGARVQVTEPTEKEKKGEDYKFSFEPRLGYKLGKVTCTFKNCAGATETFELQEVTEGESVYYRLRYGMKFNGTDWTNTDNSLAYNEKYTITAAFAKESDGVTVKMDPDAANGSASIQIAVGSGENQYFREGSKAKENDNVVFRIVPKAGYTLTAGTVKAVKADGTEITLTAKDGVYGFVMPKSLVTVKAAFTQKANAVNVTCTDKDKYLVVSEDHVAAGDVFTITLTDAAVAAGKRIDTAAFSLKKDGTPVDANKYTLTRRGLSYTVEAGTFTLNAALSMADAKYAVTYAPLKADELEGTTDTDSDGKTDAITGPAKADDGDIITLKAVPQAGHKLKEGSMVVTVTLSGGKTVSGAAVKNKQGAYTFTLPTGTITNITVKGSFDKATGEKDASRSLGVGVAVAVVEHKNEAAVKNGVVSARGLNIKASSTVNSANTAKAGYSAGDFGLAGSICVNVVNAATTALLAAVPTVTLGGGDLSIYASSKSKLTTNADSAGEKMKKGTGVGAAIAVGVYSFDVLAAIAEDAKLFGTVRDISVTASNNLEENMSSKAGSSGGTAVTPVLSMTYSENRVDAYIDKAATVLPNASGRVTISAESTAKRTITADAAAAGAKVGVGGAFIVTILRDRCKAALRRGVSADAVNVGAKSISTHRSGSRAGANGAKSRSTSPDSGDGGGESDKQAYKGADALNSLKGRSSNNSEIKSQKAETSEGSISVAAAFILNIQTHTCESLIGGGIAVTATGDVSVISCAQTDVRLNANGSATVAKIGVGVAVAINLVSYENLAHVDEAKITAKNLMICACLPEARDNNKSPDAKDSDNYIRVFLKDLLNKFVDKLMNDGALSSYKSVLSQYKDSAIELLLDVLVGRNGENLEALLAGTGLEGLVKQNPAETFLKNWDNYLAELKAYISHDDIEGLKEYLITEAVKQITPIVTKLAMSLSGAVKGGFDEAGFKGALNGAVGTIVNGFNSQWDDVKKAGVSGVLYNLFNLATKDLLKDIVNVDQLKKCVTENFKGKVIENLKSYLSKMGMALTNAALDRLSAIGNLTLPAENPVPAHTFYTYAIAGAGAFEVGVAGSAAIAVINGNTLAYISAVAPDKAAEYAVKVSGNSVIEADTVHRLETIASSSVGSNDEPATNDKAAGNGDEKKSEDTSYTTESVTVTDSENKNHSVYLTTANAVVKSKTDDKNGKYTVVYTAKEGYKFSTDSLKLDGIDKAKLSSVVSDDGKTFTVTINNYKEKELKESFTLKVTGAAADKHEIAVPGSVNTGADKVDVKLSSAKARYTDTLTVTISPKDAKANELSEENLKKAIAAKTADTTLALKIKYNDKDGKSVETSVTTYEVDKSTGSIVFKFIMPEVKAGEKLTLGMQYPTAMQLFPAIDREKQATDEKGHGIGIGAAFAFAYTTFHTQSYIGDNRRVESGALWLDAEGGLEAKTIAVSGTDPIATKNKYYNTQGLPEDSVKKTSLDAAVAFAYLAGSVKTYVGAGALITTTGGDTIDVGKMKITSGTMGKDMVNFAMTARENSSTESRASAFTAGSTTAVGACVAVNYVDMTGDNTVKYADDSGAEVTGETFEAMGPAGSVVFSGTGDIAGTAKLSATSLGKDSAFGIATAMGADMARYCAKFKSGAESANETMNKVTNGKAFEGSGSKNETGKKINTVTEKGKAQGGSSSNGNTPVSSKAARSQNAGGDSKAAIDAANSASKTVGMGNSKDGSTSSYQVAAAVAVNITAHAVKTLINGNITFGALTAEAKNNSNFSTTATGVAMSLSKKSNAVAAAVAVSVNNNLAEAEVAPGKTLAYNTVEISNVTGEKEHINGRIVISAVSSENVTEEYSRRMTAQAIAGSISGAEGDFTISGAVAIVIAQGHTRAIVGSDVVLKGGDISVTATDKARLTARAGGISISRGSTYGIGASFALIYASDEVLSSIGDRARAEGRSFTLCAERYSVNTDDYTSLDWRVLFTNSSNLTDEQRDRAKLGIIDVHKNKDTGGYSVDFNISTDTVLELIELCNYFSAVNYYVEAISGAVSGGDPGKTKLAGAGSIAMLFAKNTTRALVGNGVQVDVTDNASVTAADSGRARTIAGSVSAGAANTALGLTVGFIQDDSVVEALLGSSGAGDAPEVKASGFTLAARKLADHLVITVAMAATGTGQSGGGAVTVELMNGATRAVMKDGTVVTLHADPAKPGSIKVSADTDIRNMLVSASVEAAQKLAAGGTIAVVNSKRETISDTGRYSRLTAPGGSISVTANNKTWMMDIIASASGSAAGSAAIAGAIGVLMDEALTRARLGAGAIAEARDDIAVKASADSTELNVNVAAAFCGSGSAIGLSVFYNGLKRTVEAIADDGVRMTSSLGSIDVTADGTEWTLVVAASFDAAAKATLNGVNAITKSESTVRARIGKGAELTAWDSVAVTAAMDIKSYQISGGLAISLGSAGVGESVVVMLINNTVESVIDSASGSATKLTSHGNASGNRAGKRRGIYVGAVANESIILAAVSGNAAAGKASVSGVASALKEQNRVTAKVCEGAVLEAENGNATIEGDSADVTVEAADASSIINIAGGLGLSTSVTVGASALVTLFEKSVAADVSEASSITAAGNIRILANARDDMYLIVAGAEASTSVSVAATAAVLQYENTVIAAARLMSARDGDITVSAASDVLIYNIAAAVALSTSAAVNAVAVLTFIDCVTQASVPDSARLTAGGSISILAASREQITSDVAGGTGSSTAIGGALDYIRTKLITKAYTGNNVTLTARGDVKVEATDSYLLLGVAALLGGGLSVAVGVAVLVSFHYNTVAAELGQNNNVSGNNVSIHAFEKRDFQSLAFSAALAGSAAIGASAAVMITGGNLPADISNKLLGREIIKGVTYDVFKTSSGGKLLIPDYSEMVNGKLYAVFETGKMTDLYTEIDGVSYQIYENGQRIYYDAATGKYYVEDADRRVMEKAENVTAVNDGVSYGGDIYEPVMSDAGADASSQQVSETIKGKSYQLYNAAETQKLLYRLGSEYFIVSAVKASGLLEISAARDGATGNVLYNGASYSAAQQEKLVKVYYDSDSDAYYTMDGSGRLTGMDKTGLPGDIYSADGEVSDAGNSDSIYYNKASGKYYLRRYGSDTLTEVSVTKNADGTVTYASKKFLRSALDPQTQMDSVMNRCRAASGGALADEFNAVDDVNSTFASDGFDISQSGQQLYNGVADKDDLQANIKANAENPIGENGKNTDLVLDSANSRVGALLDATCARILSGSTVTARGDILLNAHDTLLCLALSGTVSAAGSAAVGVGASAVKLMSDVEAVAETGTVLNAAGEISISASTGAVEREFTNTREFCPVTNKLGGQTKANSTMSTIRDALEKAKLIDSSNKKASVWVVSLVPSGAGAVGVGVATGVLIYFSKAEASLQGSVTGASALTVETRVDYPQLLAAVAALGGAGTVGVGVSAGVIYLKGTALAQIADGAKVAGVTGSVNVKTSGSSVIRSAAAAAAFSGTAAVPVSAVITINKNQLASRICAGAEINTPEAALNVLTDYTLRMESLLIAVGGSFVSVAIDVLVVLGDVKSSADIEGSAVKAKSVSVGSTVKPGEGEMLKAWLVNVSGGFAAVAATAAVVINRIDNLASVRDTELTASGNVAVTAQLQSVAVVNLITAAGGFAAMPLAVAFVHMGSVNRAAVDMGTKKLSAANLSITAGPSAYSAEAALVVGSAALFQYKLYIAVVDNKAQNDARLTTGGNVDLTGELTVLSNATASSSARCNTVVEITGISISAVIAAAISRGSFSAKLELAQGAKLNVAGKVSVKSTYESGRAYAENAPMSNMPLKISLVDLGVTLTIARSYITNTAALSGSGELRAAALDVLSVLKSNAKAVNAKFAVDLNLVKVAVSGASAYILDNNSASLGEGELTVILTGKAAVIAESAPVCSAESMTPLAIGVINFELGSVDSRIKNRVSSGVGAGTKLTALEIAITASNSGDVKSRMYEGWKISVISVNKSVVATKQENTVEVFVGSGAVLTATGSSIQISASDHAKSDAAVDARSVGAVVSADFKYSENSAAQNVSAIIGEMAQLTAKANLSVTANADADMNSSTYADKYGLFAGGTVQAKNGITRNISTTVGRNAHLESRYGDVSVISQCGGKDNIITDASGKSGGLIGIGGVTSQCSETAGISTTVAYGADIIAVFGRAQIGAYGSAAKLKTCGSYSFNGFGAGPTSRAYINSLNLNMKVDVAAEQFTTGGDDGEVRANSVCIETNIPAMDISAISDTDTHMAGGSSYAYSVVTLNITGDVKLGAVDVSAYKDLNIIASVNPQTSSPAVTAIAEAYTGAAVAFMTKAQAFLEGKSVTTVTLSPGTWLTGADVDVRTSKFMATPNLRASARKAFIGRVKEETHNYFESAEHITETITADKACFHIGGGAAGIVIEYSPGENGIIQERAVGLPDKNGTYAVLTGGKIDLSSAAIGNILPGSLSIKADLSGSKIYGQKYIDSISIINSTSQTLVLGQLRPFNNAFARSTVERASNFSEEYMFVSPTEHPEITVTSTGGGNVMVGGWINNEAGSLTIRWEGTAGDLALSNNVNLEAIKVAPIWVHQLRIENARNVSGTDDRGTVDLTKPGEIFLSVFKTGFGDAAVYGDPTLSINASGTVDLKLTLAEILAWDYRELPEGNDTDLIGGTLDLGEISAGALELTCGTPMRVYYLARAEQARIIIPGVVEFMSDFKHYDTVDSSKVPFTVDEIARYFIGKSYISSGGIDTAKEKTINLNRYALPNGLTVYLVADDNAREFGYEKNELYRVVSSEVSGVSFDTSHYILKTDGSGSAYVVLRDYHNATLELSTGKLTLGDDSIDVYVGYDNGKWLVADGAEIQKETCYEYYILKYKRMESGAYEYGSDGRLQPVYDSSGKQEMERITFTLSDTPTFAADGYAYYELYYEYGLWLMTDDYWTKAKTYFARFKGHTDSDMGVFDGICTIENETLWYNTRYTKDHGYNPEGVEQYVDNFMGINGLEAWFGFHRASNSGKRFTYEYVTMKYNGVTIVNRQDKSVTDGVVQRVERLVNTNSNGGYEYYYCLNWNGLAADYYWDFSMDGGSGSNECTHVYWYRQRTITGNNFSTSEPGGDKLDKVTSYVRNVSYNKTEYRDGKQYYHYYCYGGSYGSNSKSGNRLLYDPLHYRTFYAAENLYYITTATHTTEKFKVFFASDHGYGEFGSGVDYSKIDSTGYRNGYDWGGYVHISKEDYPDAEILLWYETDPDTGVRRYRLGRDLWISSDKTVYQTEYLGMKDGKNLYELTTYNLASGDLQLIDREGEAEGQHTDTLRFCYGHYADGSKTPYMIVGGDVHYERLAEGEKNSGGVRPVIATNIFGAYFYNDGASWHELPDIDVKSGGAAGTDNLLFGSDGSTGWHYADFQVLSLYGGDTLIRDGCYRTADGAELYFGGNLVFKIGTITKNVNGQPVTKIVHSMYYLKGTNQENVLRYSVDQDGVVYWSESSIKKRGADLFYFGGREEPGHVSYKGLATDVTTSLKVEAGVVIAIAPSATAPDLVLKSLTLCPKDLENSPRREGGKQIPIPAGKLVVPNGQQFNDISIDTINIASSLDLTARGGISVANGINAQDAALTLRAGKGITIGDIDAKNSTVTAITKNSLDGKLTVGNISAQGGAVELRAKNDSLSIGNVTGRDAALTLQGETGLTAGDVDASHGTLTMLSTGRIKAGELRCDSVGENPDKRSYPGASAAIDGFSVELDKLTVNYPTDLFTRVNGADNVKIGTMDVKNGNMKVTGGSAVLGNVTADFGNVFIDNRGTTSITKLTTTKTANVYINSGGAVSVDELISAGPTVQINSGDRYNGFGDVVIKNSDFTDCRELSLTGRDIKLLNNTGNIANLKADAKGDFVLGGSGSAELGNVTAAGLVDINIGGALTAKSGTSLVAGKGLAVKSGSNVTLNNVTARSGNVRLEGGAVTAGNVRSEGGNIDIVSTRDVTITNALAHGKVSIRSELGSVLDSSVSDADRRIQETLDAQNAADYAHFMVQGVVEMQQKLEAEKAKTEKELGTVQEKIKELEKKENPDQRELDRLNEQLDILEDKIRMLDDEMDVNRQEYNDLIKTYEEKQQLLNRAKRALRAALNGGVPTVEAKDGISIKTGGSIGSRNNPLIIKTPGNVELISIPAGPAPQTDGTEVNVFADDELNLSGVTGGSVTLSSIGSVTDDSLLGVPISGGTVRITSLEGDVGSKARPLNMTGTELITTSGNNVFMYSDDPIMLGGMVAARGTSPADLPAGGTLEIKSDKGVDMLTGTTLVYRITPEEPDPDKPGPAPATSPLKWRVLYDEPSGVMVAGYLSDDAELHVNVLDAKSDGMPSLAFDKLCEACRAVFGAWKLHSRVAAYGIVVTGERSGKLTVTLELDALADGTTVSLLCCVDGRLMLLSCQVRNGCVSFRADGQTMYCMLFTDAEELRGYCDGLRK